MIGPAGADRLRVDFLACPAEALLDDFIGRPDHVEPDLVRAVSRHLARCPSCRDEADRQRRGHEESAARRPWLWAGLALGLLVAGAAIFLSREVEAPGARSSAVGSVRPDARLAALARFEPPRLAAGPLPGRLEPEDLREFIAARGSLEAGRFADAARLMEDLVARQPDRAGLRLLLAYALARAGELERAHQHYHVAERLGGGEEACRGLLNSSLKLGDLATARHELAAHLLEGHPEDPSLRDLLSRIDSYRPGSAN